MGIETLPPPTRPAPTRPGDDQGYGKPVHIIVLNDDHNTFEHVAQALARYLPGVSYSEGMAFANTIHNSGQARVWSGPREQAELYHEQLTGAGLTLAPLA